MKTSMSPSCNSLSLPLPSLSKCIQLPLPSGSLLPGEYRDYCLYLHIPPHYTNVSQLPWNIVMQYQPLSNTDCLVRYYWFIMIIVQMFQYCISLVIVCHDIVKYYQFVSIFSSKPHLYPVYHYTIIVGKRNTTNCSSNFQFIFVIICCSDIYDSLLLSVNIDNNQSGIPGGPSHITVHQISTVSRYWSITKTTNECELVLAARLYTCTCTCTFENN